MASVRKANTSDSTSIPFPPAPKPPGPPFRFQPAEQQVVQLETRVIKVEQQVSQHPVEQIGEVFKSSHTIDLKPLSTIAVIIPSQTLLSYYISVEDELFGIDHYVHETDEAAPASRSILIKNQLDLPRRIKLHWF